MKFYYLSRFRNDPTGHGGDKRAVQIREVFSGKGEVIFQNVEESELPIIFTQGLLRNLRIQYWIDWIRLRLVAPLNRYYGWDKDFYQKFIFERQRKFRAASETFDLNGDWTLLIDDPLYSVQAFTRIKRRGIKTIGLVHNIESMVRGQYQDQQKALNYEIESMVNCDELITISEEDSKILISKTGKVPEFIPYQAPSDVVREMEQIAKKRKITAKSGYLLLGSFFNPPTREGIFEFLEQYATQIADLKKPIFVGGFGSSSYQEEIENRGVKFVGEVTKDQLQELYETTSGAICYQTWGSGALTRISEYLNASIPVYANDFACRSYRRQVGIKPIENLFEDHKSQIDAVSED